MLILNARDLDKALPFTKAIEAMREAFTALASDTVLMPQRLSLAAPERNGRYLFMPASAEGAEVLTLKALSLYDTNPQVGLPNIQGGLLLFDSQNGKPLALLEASRLTAIRTGATCALATDLLANQEASILTIFGSGPQAKAQIDAICSIRPIAELRICSRNLRKAQRLTEAIKAEKPKLKVLAVESSKKALEATQIISTATNSASPVFAAHELPEGTHLNAIGSYLPHVQELPAEVLTKAFLVVDSREHALAETGDFIIPLKQGSFKPEQIKAELGELVQGNKKGREAKEQITLFKSVGLAIQDTFAAKMAYLEALKAGYGQAVDF